MKITKSELQQIIKEEAARFVQTKALESRKNEIQKQLNEMYAEESVAEESFDESVAEESFAESMAEESFAESVAEESFAEEGEEMEEGLKDMFVNPRKKEAAKNLVKTEIEAAINNSPAAPEQKQALLAKMDAYLAHAEKKFNFNALPAVQQSSKGDWIVTMKDAGPQSKVGKFLAAAGAGAGQAMRSEAINESEIRKIFREEAERAEKIKTLEEQARKVISEMEELGMDIEEGLLSKLGITDSPEKQEANKKAILANIEKMKGNGFTKFSTGGKEVDEQTFLQTIEKNKYTGRLLPVPKRATIVYQPGTHGLSRLAGGAGQMTVGA